MKTAGKIAWITGASSGIGEALAGELFHRGATVILSARSTAKLEEIKSRSDEISPGRCHVVPCDITRPESVRQAVAIIRELVDHIDILINNAGMSQRSQALDTSPETERELFEVNYFGAVMVTKSILPWMISTGGGNVTLISSMAGKFGFRMRSSYSASKHALHGYFETLRAETHDQNVHITLICPGRVRTNISINSVTADGKKYGIMDRGQEKGIPVEKCARIIVKSLEQDRKEVFIGKTELMLLVIKRVCPALYYRIVNNASPT